MLNKRQKQEKVSVGLYPDVLKMVDDEAERQKRSRSNMLDVIIREYFRPKIEEETKAPKPLAR